MPRTTHHMLKHGIPHVPYHMSPHYLQIWPSVLYQNILHSGLVVLELYLAQIHWCSSNSGVWSEFELVTWDTTGLWTDLGKDIGDCRLPDEQILGQSVSRTLYINIAIIFTRIVSDPIMFPTQHRHIWDRHKPLSTSCSNKRSNLNWTEGDGPLACYNSSDNDYVKKNFYIWIISKWERLDLNLLWKGCKVRIKNYDDGPI